MARRRHKPHAPDFFQSTFRAFYLQLSRLRWLVLAGAVSVASLLLGFSFLVAALGEIEDAAVEKFDRAATPEELEELVRDYPRYVGPQASLMLGNMLFARFHEAADADEKRAHLSRALDAFSKGAHLFPKHFFTPYLLEGEGLCLEEMGRHKEAVGAFRRAQEAGPKGFLVPKLDADIGRNLILAGEEEEARFHLEQAVYSRMRIGRGMETDWLLAARLLLARISSKEVEPAPAAPETPEAPTGGETEPAPPEKPEGETGAKPAGTESPAPGHEDTEKD